MRKRRVLALLALALLIPLSNAAGVAETGTAKVMVLGVAHLVRHRDVHNSVFQGSPLSPRRQGQIADIVGRLARFHPTKVLIEATMGDPVFAERYKRFVTGHFSLLGNCPIDAAVDDKLFPCPADEIYQIGFRLAAAAGDSTIYPIDVFGPTLIDDTIPSGQRMEVFLASNFASFSTPSFAAYLARTDALERNGTYLDLLRYLNTDSAIHANASGYSVLDAMGRGVDDAGAAYVSQWYARNCYIFSNIVSVIRPGDRVVVIMGQGHEYLLRELVRLNPNLLYVDPLDYLR